MSRTLHARLAPAADEGAAFPRNLTTVACPLPGYEALHIAVCVSDPWPAIVARQEALTATARSAARAAYGLQISPPVATDDADAETTAQQQAAYDALLTQLADQRVRNCAGEIRAAAYVADWVAWPFAAVAPDPADALSFEGLPTELVIWLSEELWAAALRTFRKNLRAS